MSTSSLTPSHLLAAGLVVTVAPAMALAGSVTHYTADLRPVGVNSPVRNDEFDDDGDLPDLQADFTVDTTGANDELTSGNVSVNYRVRGSGFNDLTGIPGAVHLVHLHSQFPENFPAGSGPLGKPIPQQLNGDFFTGGPSDPIPSVPSAESAAGRNVDDNYLDFLEEVPELGPVSFYLGKTDIEAPEDGVPPLINLLTKIQDGEIDPKTYLPDESEFEYEHTRTFDLSEQDQRRLILNVIGPDGDEFDQRVIDAHGFSVPDDLSDAIDATVFGVGDPDLSQDTVNGFPTLLAGAPLGDGTEFRVTGPAVTGGDITNAVPTPSAAIAGLGMLGGMALRRRRRVRH